MPLQFKLQNGESKWLLRRMLEKYVPQHLFERPKMGFGVPIDYWLRGKLREWIDDLLSAHKLEADGLLNSSFNSSTLAGAPFGKKKLAVCLMECADVPIMAGADLKKILMVVNEAKFFISHRLSLAKTAKVAGYEVHVATPPSHWVKKIAEAGLIFHPIKLDRSGFNPFKDITTLFSLYRLYRRLKPDIVHHLTLKPILYGGIAVRLARVSAMVNALIGLWFILLLKLS